jgi:cytochrome c553
MITMAKQLSDEENKVIADYYATLKPKPWTKIIEAAMAPKTYVANNNQRRLWPEGGTEPTGDRVIEYALDLPNLRAATSPGHVAYVPPGSIAEGERLVKTGGGKATACVTCHGANLTGNGDIPGIAGRSPVYTARQIYMYQDGDRAGPQAEIMKGVVAKLNDHDIVAITAYLASRPPT